MRYRFKSDHNTTLEPEGELYRYTLNGSRDIYGTFTLEEVEERLQHGIIEPIQEPREASGTSYYVSRGMNHPEPPLFGLPEGKWEITYSATEVL